MVYDLANPQGHQKTRRLVNLVEDDVYDVPSMEEMTPFALGVPNYPLPPPPSTAAVEVPSSLSLPPSKDPLLATANIKRPASNKASGEGHIRGGYCDFDCMSPLTIQRLFDERTRALERLATQISRLPWLVYMVNMGANSIRDSMYNLRMSPLHSLSLRLNITDPIIAAAVPRGKYASSLVDWGIASSGFFEEVPRKLLSILFHLTPTILDHRASPSPSHYGPAVKATTSTGVLEFLSAFTPAEGVAFVVTSSTAKRRASEEKVPLSLHELGDA
ncbi:hypothetical protein FRC04_002195 [Tulasnella sp. 424]|nr:hypothetical protein FRC04_002195 [Tulasnella sp. 424]KAG8967743.1 hypothetical protein FRC05_001922 [Tulasnella sp. 425]